VKISTAEYIQNLLSNELRHLLTLAAKPDMNKDGLGRAIEECSAALVDHMQTNGAPADNTAAVALEMLRRGRKPLADLMSIMENGTAKGSSTHQFVKRLNAIIEEPETLTEQAPAA
jgi:hypothetical protein